jgi:hypothetical protein
MELVAVRTLAGVAPLGVDTLVLTHVAGEAALIDVWEGGDTWMDGCMALM